MNMTICIPGITFEITDADKMDTACEMVNVFMSKMFYEDEYKNNILTIYKDGETMIEIALTTNSDNDSLQGFTISNEWYCLPDALDVVTNMITDN